MIYEIRIEDDNYIGSTKDIFVRIRQHRFDAKTKNIKLYKRLRENNYEFEIDILEENIAPELLLEYERQYILNLKPTLNMVIPIADKKQYYKEYKNIYNKLDIECVCGRTTRRTHFAIHLETKIHKKLCEQNL